MPNPKHNYIQQFHDFTDKYDYINEQLPYVQTKEDADADTWYPATKKVKESLAIRLSLILKSDSTYQIYLENFIKKEDDPQQWQVHINSIEFKHTCKLDLESILNKWNHQLAIK